MERIDMIYKVTHMMNRSVMGASESWYTGDWSATQALQYIQELLAARMALVTYATETVGVRLAVYGAKRQSVVLLPPYDVFPGTNSLLQIPAKGTYTGEVKNFGSDQYRAALQNRITYDNTRTVLRYMSGIPDAVSATEPATVDFSLTPQWKQALDRYYNILSSRGWSIRAKAITGINAPASVTGVTSMAAAPSLLGIILPAATAPPIVQGSSVQLQHFRAAKFTRNPTINGGWTVDSINTTLVPGSLIVYLRNSGTIDPTTVRITALSTIQLVGYSLFTVQNVTWVRCGIHKRGRPSMAPRGRRLSRPTLDP
jgi:hypothetical protein